MLWMGKSSAIGWTDLIVQRSKWLHENQCHFSFIGSHEMIHSSLFGVRTTATYHSWGPFVNIWREKNIRFNNTSRSKSCDFQHVCLMYIIHFVMCSTASGSDFAFSFFCYSPCSFCSRIHAFIFCGVLFHLKRGFNKCRRWREALGFFSSQNTQRGGNNQQELTDFLESVWLERHKQQATGVRRRCL